MADEPEDDVAADETPSDEAAPAEEEESETPSDDEEAAEEAADEDEDSGEEPAEGLDASEAEDEPSDTERPTTPAARRAWDSLEAKFKWIKDPEDRKEAVAKAYWEKARYDKQIRLENEALKAENAALKAKAEKTEPEEPAQPHPDVVRIEQRMQALYQRKERIQAEQKDRLVELNKLDRAVAVAEDRLKDAFDEQKPTFQARLEAAQRDYAATRREWMDSNEKIGDLDEKLQQEAANREWVIKFQREQAEQLNLQAQSRQQFMEEFPRHVDSMIEAAAKDLGIPDDERIRQSLWKHVNRALQVDLRVMNRPDVGEVPIRAMVTKFVKEYAEDRDLVRRKAFKAKSDAKLAVTDRTGTGVRKAPSAPAKSVPGAMKPAIPVSLLGGDSTPGMARARAQLVKRFGG